MTQEDHFDVASYALGVLDEHDAARFEDHLIECSRCAYELESFVEVADLLADVDANAVVAAEETRRDGFMLQKVIGEVSHERQRANSRRLFSLAAAVVIFAMLSIGAFFVGGQVFGKDSDPATTNTAQRDESQLDPLPNSDGGPGIGGPDLVGERFDGSDPRTGVSASVAFEKKKFGTQISYSVSNISGPKTCRLVAVHTDGTTEAIQTWTVGEQGWGTAANPEPLLLQATTATPRDEIAHMLVQEVSASGAGETLVRVP
ncbi:zf-HC2 domain-containing protein [Actinoplanes bogorensis]|uniref:Zf-HC2 domain-containing protein n=1 Tax=Paractinoplanes bogorensis TaxID=1610840 RepID=A0ABS5YG66_9ACTN|nr:zf-HC2 domain-containing protein [Actinoplanes bogorensis]MBU2662435.1 zf-HC2 domain-containing protein [Actinoplanes bogorensis]